METNKHNKVMKATGNNFKSTVEKFFNAEQQQAIKDAILYGEWGDADIEFSTGCYNAYGFITNETDKGGHFKGREVTKIWSQIARIIKSTEAAEFMSHRHDYWADGSGDAVFIRLEGFFKGGYDSFVEWAKVPVKQPRPSAEVRCALYLKELKEKEGIENPNKETRKRIASLKRKIARASKAIEKSLKNA